MAELKRKLRIKKYKEKTLLNRGKQSCIVLNCKNIVHGVDSFHKTNKRN